VSFLLPRFHLHIVAIQQVFHPILLLCSFFELVDSLNSLFFINIGWLYIDCSNGVFSAEVKKGRQVLVDSALR